MVYPHITQANIKIQNTGAVWIVKKEDRREGEKVERNKNYFPSSSQHYRLAIPIEQLYYDSQLKFSHQWF